MSTIVKYNGPACASGVAIPFSGISLPLHQNYRVEFSCISRMPESTYTIDPTGFYLFPSEKNMTFTTIFSAINQYTLYNSSSNIIKLSIYNESNMEIYRDYAAVSCGNLSSDPAQPNPTPTMTSSLTPTPTITPSLTVTPTPSITPPINFSASFDQLTQELPSCGQIIVRGLARGVLNKTYSYSFTTDMTTNNDMIIGNQTGTVTITSNPTYVYTSISMYRPCDHYSLKFGLSDGSITVQSVGFFRCGECS